MDAKLRLGVEGRDKVTGFTGIATGKAEYLYGCTQYVLVPKHKKGVMEAKGGAWFDEGRIEVIGKGISAEEVKGTKNGGPNSDAPKGTH